jgi:tetratricopeptide (TPR) repeat protein
VVIMTDRDAEQRFAEAASLRRAGRFAEAAAAYEAAIVAAPMAMAPHTGLGTVLLQLGRPRAAMAAFADAVDRDPHLQAVCRDPTGATTEDARAQVVLENCGHILARHPNYAEAHYGKARALLTLGHEAEARRAAEHALVLNPTVPGYYHVLIHTGDVHSNANAVATLEQLARVASELEPEDRTILHFLLAKAYEDQGRKADAFDQLVKGNAAKRAIIAYDEGRELGRMRQIADAFPAARFSTSAGCDSELPVFVIGMPRSGTTLVEQILASHPDVYGAGELALLPEMIARHLPGFPAGSTPEPLTKLGEDYAARLGELAPQAKRVVDKLPYNFLNAGLIALALPKARIVHITRDALDTCYSCFALSFAGDVGFAYDMGELGRYYRAYEALMAHWRQVLPAGAMLEVAYEELVADLEPQARRLIAFCGLDWDARCLDFHKSGRAVVTASVHQVRRPIYHSSVGRAAAFAEYLTPLRAALGIE